MCDEENVEAVARALAKDRKPSCVDPPTTFRLLPPPSSLQGSQGSQTDHFLNHSWALPRRERHAESWGSAMRKVSLFLSYAVIYDTEVVTDLIITLYFPSEGKKGKVSDSGLFSFHFSSFVPQTSPPASMGFSFFFLFPTLLSYTPHKYAFKIHKHNKEFSPLAPSRCLTQRLVRGESLDTVNVL